jgi:hypothetical protein
MAGVVQRCRPLGAVNSGSSGSQAPGGHPHWAAAGGRTRAAAAEICIEATTPR